MREDYECQDKCHDRNEGAEIWDQGSYCCCCCGREYGNKRCGEDHHGRQEHGCGRGEGRDNERYESCGCGNSWGESHREQGHVCSDEEEYSCENSWGYDKGREDDKCQCQCQRQRKSCKPCKCCKPCDCCCRKCCW